MEQILDRMEAHGSQEDAEALRRQLIHLLPTVWEEELSAKVGAIARELAEIDDAE